MLEKHKVGHEFDAQPFLSAVESLGAGTVQIKAPPHDTGQDQQRPPDCSLVCPLWGRLELTWSEDCLLKVLPCHCQGRSRDQVGMLCCSVSAKQRLHGALGCKQACGFPWHEQLPGLLS